MAVTVRPLEDRVVIRPIEAGEQKKGLIYIPDVAKEKPQEGEVIEVGPGRMLESGQIVPCVLKKGDRVLHQKYTGTLIEINGEQCLITRESDIIAVLEASEAATAKQPAK